MSLSKYLAMASIVGAMLPNEHDWDVKIDNVISEYRKSKNLPRKLKKKKRKQLTIDYNLYTQMKGFSIF